MSHIPLSKPLLDEKVWDNLKECFASGKLSGDGPFCRMIETKMQAKFSCKHILLTSSCTHSLEMCMHLLNADSAVSPKGLPRDDKNEVILPSFTFSSTANAILLAGLKPVFCDSEASTMNIDVKDLERKITKRTRCVIPVHYAGVACDMGRILELSQAHNFMIVEDAAQGIGAKWHGHLERVPEALGTIGNMGAYSFHDTKNVVCGEGGAFLTNDTTLSDKAEIFREKGTNRKQFFRGVIDKYTWIEKGSSTILAEPLAAILASQFDDMENLNKKRGEIYYYYLKELAPLSAKEILILPKIPSYATTNYHIFHILLRTNEQRNSLIDHLRSLNIVAAFHYLPLHASPQGKKLGYKLGDFPICEEYSARLLRLPLYPSMSDQDKARVVEGIFSWAH